MYGVWNRSLDLERCLPTVIDDVSKEYSHRNKRHKIQNWGLKVENL
jgi:hypothetical protein